jgi:hypothetical protein
MKPKNLAKAVLILTLNTLLFAFVRAAAGEPSGDKPDNPSLDIASLKPYTTPFLPLLEIESSHTTTQTTPPASTKTGNGYGEPFHRHKHIIHKIIPNPNGGSTEYLVDEKEISRGKLQATPIPR